MTTPAPGRRVLPVAGRLTSPPVLLDLSGEAAAHLTAAIGRYRREQRLAGMAVPVELEQLAAALASRARRGQDGTQIDLEAVTAQPAPTHRRLLRYAEVAESLGISERSVKRLIAANELLAVRIGPGISRVRTADLDAYVAALAEEE